MAKYRKLMQPLTVMKIHRVDLTEGVCCCYIYWRNNAAGHGQLEKPGHRDSDSPFESLCLRTEKVGDGKLYQELTATPASCRLLLPFLTATPINDGNDNATWRAGIGDELEISADVINGVFQETTVWCLSIIVPDS